MPFTCGEDAAYTGVRAPSSGLRNKGRRFITRGNRLGSPVMLSPNRVLVGPGSTQLTATPVPFSRRASKEPATTEIIAPR